MTLVFATNNTNKVAEVRAMLPAGLHIHTMAEAGFHIDIPETGATIRENSILKARHLQDLIGAGNDTGVMAEDSGLEVDVLGGSPGVYSARYAGPEKDDSANMRKLLQELQTAPHRRARFVTVITLIVRGELHIFEGEVKGTIAFEPRGSAGFGYDPVFIPTGYRSTFAELGPSVKNEISHRAKAVARMLEFLKERAFR